jgi:alpha-L-rhamnosidase
VSSPTLPFTGESAWIWSAEGSHAIAPPEQRSPSHYQVRRFQLVVELDDFDEVEALVHVSADSRFLFYCNGNLVGRGPAKGDIDHHFYDTFELAPHLRPGSNVIAALVLDMSKVAHRPTDLGAPCSVMTYAGGFLLEGHIRTAGKEHILHTGQAAWRVAVDRDHHFQNDGTRFEGYHGYFEDRHDSLNGRTWLYEPAPGDEWPKARSLYLAERLENRRDPTSPYGLVPRMIPQLPEGEPTGFSAAFLPGGAELAADQQGIANGSARVTVAAGAETEFILDVGELTSGYPVIQVAGGRTAVIRLTYAEALRLPWDTPDAVMLGEQQPLENLASHFADEGTGWTFDRRGAISGWSDTWHPAGGEASEFEPWHWRAFRYIGVKVTAGAEPIEIKSIRFRYSAYPYELKARFTCSDPSLERIFQAGVRTMQLCAHETFEDCPHYEQMQYAGDTMITSHLGMLTSGDYRLSRQALYQFDWSRGPDGLTHSRFPSRLRQVIPSWSLHWITAVRDFGMCSGDLVTVRDALPGTLAVLDWFRRHRDERGLPAKLPYWNVTDWCPWWPRGVVPGADTGPTCIISAQWIKALDEVAEMFGWLGEIDQATALRAEAAATRKVLHDTFWSEAEGLYFDRPGGPEISQYGNAWAVAVGAADQSTCERMKARFPHDPKLAPGSFFAWHTAFKAMRIMGTYDTMAECLGPWHESIQLGLDTFVEENSYWRSLCHAWSAHPVLEFLNHTLGIQPTAPGFATIRIQPRPGQLTAASGRVCTPRGFVEVAWKRHGDTFDLQLSAPDDTPVEIILPDGTVHQSAGGDWSSHPSDPAS